MKYLFVSLAVLALFIIGCGNPSWDAPERQPVLIAEKDGVKLYAVRHYCYPNDSFQWVYFSTPSGVTTWQQRQGKSSVQKNVPGVPKD